MPKRPRATRKKKTRAVCSEVCAGGRSKPFKYLSVSGSTSDKMEHLSSRASHRLLARMNSWRTAVVLLPAYRSRKEATVASESERRRRSRATLQVWCVARPPPPGEANRSSDIIVRRGSVPSDSSPEKRRTCTGSSEHARHRAFVVVFSSWDSCVRGSRRLADFRRPTHTRTHTLTHTDTHRHTHNQTHTHREISKRVGGSGVNR